MKICKTCNQSQSADQFYSHRADCKSCVSAKYHANKQLKGRPTTTPRPIPHEHTCTCCKLTLPINQFYVGQPQQGRKSVRISSKCRPCTQLHYGANRSVIRDKRHAKNPPKGRSYPNRMTPEQTQARQTAYARQRRQNNPLVKLRNNIGTAIANSLSATGRKKRASTVSILACTIQQLSDHLESQFVPGMNWNNRSLWHIDHIVPVSFANTEQELIQLNHYTNLRPLWRDHNLTKAGSLTQDSVDHPIYKQIMENRIWV